MSAPTEGGSVPARPPAAAADRPLGAEPRAAALGVKASSRAPDETSAQGLGGKSRVSRIVRCSARLTSVPVFGLVLASLATALPNLAVATRDDKTITVGLCGTCIGLILGWRWAGIGGAVTVASCLPMLGQGEGFLNPDPFALAFALQGILFLLSAVLNRRGPGAAASRLGWLRGASAGVLAVGALAGAAVLFRGPGPAPISREKATFVGLWENGSGLSIEITADGRAKVTRAIGARVEESNTPVPPGKTAVFQAVFRGDDELELDAGLFGRSKIYRIERHPYREGRVTKMVLNGTEPTKPGSALALVKQSP